MRSLSRLFLPVSSLVFIAFVATAVLADGPAAPGAAPAAPTVTTPAPALTPPADTVPDPAAWQSVITGQIDAFRKGDSAGALSFAGAMFQKTFTDPSMFMVAIAQSGYIPIFTSVSHSFGTFTQPDALTVVQVVELVGPKQELFEAIYALAKEAFRLARAGRATDEEGRHGRLIPLPPAWRYGLDWFLLLPLGAAEVLDRSQHLPLQRRGGVDGAHHGALRRQQRAADHRAVDGAWPSICWPRFQHGLVAIVAHRRPHRLPMASSSGRRPSRTATSVRRSRAASRSAVLAPTPRPGRHGVDGIAEQRDVRRRPGGRAAPRCGSLRGNTEPGSEQRQQACASPGASRRSASLAQGQQVGAAQVAEVRRELCRPSPRCPS